MIKTWLLWLSLFVYPILLVTMDNHIRRRIPEKAERKKFMKEKEYLIKLVYLFTPLLLFHLELAYLNAGYSFIEMGTMAVIALFSLQGILLIRAAIHFYRFFKALKQQNHRTGQNH